MDVVLPMEFDVDLIIVDFGVNDAIIEEMHYDLDYVRMAHEELIRYVRNDMTKSPALFYVESFIAPNQVVQNPLQATNMANVHAEVTQKYDIPMVRRAFWVDVVTWYHRTCVTIVVAIE